MTQMPIVGEYRGVRLHAFQSEHRIVTVVKPVIDKAYSISDVRELMALLTRSANPPEARLCAAALVKAISERAADKRTPRPDVAIGYIDACTAGLDSLNWACLDRYTTDLDVGSDDAAPRPAEFQKQLAEYQRRAA